MAGRILARAADVDENQILRRGKSRTQLLDGDLAGGLQLETRLRPGFDPATERSTHILEPDAREAHDRLIDRGGFDTKEKLIQWVYENALMPAGEYWDYQLIQNYIYPRATFGEEPYASKLEAAPDAMVKMFKPEEIHVVVVGGETNGYWRIMGCGYQKTVSVDGWR